MPSTLFRGPVNMITVAYLFVVLAKKKVSRFPIL